MNVLLVASPISLPEVENLTKMPNLGLASIAGNIDKTCFNVKILDLVLAHNPIAFFKKLLFEFKPDTVVFSSMTFQYNRTLEFASITKEFNPDITVLLA